MENLKPDIKRLKDHTERIKGDISRIMKHWIWLAEEIRNLETKVDKLDKS